jgi:MFS family permease
MTESNAAPHPLTLTHWLIIIIASIGFAFDTYELLMTPLAAPPAIAELLRVPINNPLVTEWMGRLLWITALCGGVFGLMGGWLIDRFGRKSVMAASIFVYSFSPVLAAFSNSIGLFLFFRCTTFIGVCVEFVAAISWLAEVFTDKQQRVKWLGITQAFASVGGLMVTGVNVWIVAHAQSFPHFGMPIAMGGEHPASWRYLLLTGLIPALPIALMLPFVPESRLWQEQKRAGTLKRPSFGALFTPALRRVTLVTAGLSACAYGVAFGALQLTPLRIAPGLTGLETERKARAPLVQEARQLNEQLNAAPAGSPERKTLVDAIKANVTRQAPLDRKIKEVGNRVQLAQELGGLMGRIALAVLIILAVPRRLLLRLFQVPGLVLLPATYLALHQQGETAFAWGVALCGFVTVAQFSYFGEYLPKAFPLHLRGTGASFATNVGGRMIGTSAAFITTSVAGALGGDPFRSMARAAGWVGLTIVVISLILSFLLPEPKDAVAEDLKGDYAVK